jgi:hypothetical protein
MSNRATFLIAISVVAIAATNAAAQPGNSDRPQITSIRIGVANHYKVGHWTGLHVDVAGIAGLENPRIEVRVVDNDGVRATTAAPLTKSTMGGARETAIVYTKVGKLATPIQVVLADGEVPVAERTLSPQTATQSNPAAVELPSTAELLVALSPAPFGMKQSFPAREASGNEPARRTVELNDVDQLPVDWFGYEAVDVLVISAGDGALCRQLADDNVRFAALVRWVELGGRLVILCGAEGALVVLQEEGPLARLVPGTFVDVVPTELGPLEQFAEPAPPIPVSGRNSTMRVPRLIDVPGHIEVYSGRRPTDLPLVVRAVRGLGEVTFAGVDLAKPPLADWSGRREFLHALLRPYVSTTVDEEESQTLVARGYSDLSGALRQRLGRSFASVVPIAFWMIAIMAIAYLAALGPIDYWLVQRWLHQPLAAWITFPIIVLLFGTGALGLAEWRLGSSMPGVNRLELVDVDTLTGQARGTFWATLFSPRARQFDLTLQVDTVAIESSDTELLISSWGLPGTGIGGMESRPTGLDSARDSYRYASELEALHGVPVNTSATKSLLVRWAAPVSGLMEAQLRDQDGLATGSIVNRTGRPLRNVRLLYNDWGYWLGNMTEDQQIEVGEHIDSRKVKTIVTGSALGRTATGANGQSQRSLFSPERASALEILTAMMFHEAVGGPDFTQLPNRYQTYCDLSGLLKPGMGRAILVAQAEGAGSRLFDENSSEPLGNGDDFDMVVYRFVLPVAKSFEER